MNLEKVFGDARLQSLLKLEADNLLRDPKKLKAAFIKGYTLAGGNLSNAEEISALFFRRYAEAELQTTELPGPQSIWTLLRPKLLDVVELLIRRLFRDLTRV